MCLVFVFVLLSFSTRESSGAEEAGKMELSATLKYVEDWASRDSFPDSPSFAYMNVFSRLALGGRLSDAEKRKTVDYLKKCQKPDGGFVNDPEIREGAAAGSNIISTCFALCALDLVDSLAAIDREKAVDYVLSLVRNYGAIKLSGNGGSANLGTTYYGIRSLCILKALDRIDRERATEYIKSHRAGDRGFGVLPGKPSAPQTTFMAVKSLSLLNALTDDIGAGVGRYLEETPYSGLSDPENIALMNMENMACVLETAALVSALPQFDTDKIKEFIQSRYVPENGGFGPSAGLGTTPPSTFYAVRCLVELGISANPPASGL